MAASAQMIPCSQQIELRVVADIKAGAINGTHQGEAARIMTGAPLPAGAGAVVSIEDTDISRNTDSVFPDSYLSIKWCRR
jgi:molybdopterin biosynthesis enzyme